MDDRIKASVIVATAGRREVLLNTLESLLQEGSEGCEAEFEILVVEQPPYRFSLDEIHSWKKSRSPCRWIRMENPNLPQARNIGILNSSGEVIIFVDDDMRFEKGFIQAHIQGHGYHNVGAVAGRVVNNPIQGFWENFWSRRTPFFSPVSGTLYGGFDINREPQLVTTAIGANMSLSREAITKAGGFDPNFEKVALREEADALERIKKLGCQILYEPRAFAWHLRVSEGGERLHNPSEFLYWSRRSESLFISKNYTSLVWYAFLLRSSAVTALRGILRLTLLQDVRASLRGTISGRAISHHTPKYPNFLAKAQQTETILKIQ